MFKNFFLCVIIFTNYISFSQDISNSIPIKLKNDRDVFQVVDNDNNNVILFLSDKKRVEVFKLDERMKIVDTFRVNRPLEKFKDMVGYCFENSKIGIVWATENLMTINYQQFNFENHKSFNKELNIDLKNERFLQKFSEKNKFYIATIVVNTSILKLYVFDIEGNMSEKIIDFSTLNFIKSNGKKTNFYDFCKENLGAFEPSFSLQKINIESPSSLAESAKKRKCYSNENEIILTFDTSNSYTQLITIDTQNYTFVEKLVYKPAINPVDLNNSNTNSFLYKKEFYQIITSPNEIKIILKKLDSEISQEWIIEKDKEIDFKNSDLIEEMGTIDSKTTIEKTSKFIRKVNNLNAGISCYNLNGNNLITIGSVSEAKGSVGGGAIAAGLFGVVGVFMYYAVSNPTIESFNSYSNRNVVYVNCLFDNDGKHINSEINKLAFSKISSYLSGIEDFESLTLFKSKNNYFLGYYYKEKKEFVIRKFVD